MKSDRCQLQSFINFNCTHSLCARSVRLLNCFELLNKCSLVLDWFVLFSAAMKSKKKQIEAIIEFTILVLTSPLLSQLLPCFWQSNYLVDLWIETKWQSIFFNKKTLIIFIPDYKRFNCSCFENGASGKTGEQDQEFLSEIGTGRFFFFYSWVIHI